jgi:hypothetical protein
VVSYGKWANNMENSDFMGTTTPPKKKKKRDNLKGRWRPHFARVVIMLTNPKPYSTRGCVALWPCHLHFKSILRLKKNYGNSNTSPCKNIIFKKSLNPKSCELCGLNSRVWLISVKKFKFKWIWTHMLVNDWN